MGYTNKARERGKTPLKDTQKPRVLGKGIWTLFIRLWGDVEGFSNKLMTCLGKYIIAMVLTALWIIVKKRGKDFN